MRELLDVEEEESTAGEEMEPVLHQVAPSESGRRLDLVLRELFPDCSRNYLQRQIQNGNVQIDGRQAKKNGVLLQEGSTLSVFLPPPVPAEILPENLPLSILYEDDDLLVVDKPKGMVVHPAPGHTSKTLVNALLYHCSGSLSGINGELRPGIVHRIDKDTSGLLVVCKNDQAHQALAKQLQSHSITRVYEAVAVGEVKEDGTIHKPIGRSLSDRKKMAVVTRGGRDSTTHYHVLERLCAHGEYTHLSCTLETGRTHQIRVHLASIGHPLLGDFLYGSGREYQTAAKDPSHPFHLLQGQMLHAKILGFVHPRSGEYLEFSSSPPDSFVQILDWLR